MIFVGASLAQERIVLEKHRGKGLQAVSLEIAEAIAPTGNIGTEEIVKLLQSDVCRIMSFHQSAWSQHIVVIDPLGGVHTQAQTGQHIVQFGTCQGILFLIKIIGGSDDVELRLCIHPKCHLMGRKVFFPARQSLDEVLRLTLCTEEAVTSSRTLAGLHLQHIGAQQV